VKTVKIPADSRDECLAKIRVFMTHTSRCVRS
jgi:hypothetical protein